MHTQPFASWSGRRSRLRSAEQRGNFPMSHWFDTLALWLESNPHWLALTLLVMACVECLAIVGLLIPGTVVLFSLGVLAGSGALELWQTLLLGYVGGLLGDLASYGLGRRYHQGIRDLSLLRKHPGWLNGAERYFERYGVASLLVGRFIGPLRPMLPMVAGMLDMPFVRFLLVSLLAAAGWSVAYLLPGWATGAALRLPLPDGFWGEAGAVIGSVALMLVLVIHSSLRETRWATLLAGGLSATLLLAMLLGAGHLQALDQGLMALVQEQRAPAMDSAAFLITGLGDFDTQLAAGVLLTLLLLMGVNYGLDSVRFIQPVKVNSRVRLGLKVTEVTEKRPGQWLIKSEATLEIEGEEKPAYIAEPISLCFV
ncbi:UNVERIFIED_CONTAM: yabI [Trichonephila clavipes]